MNIELNQELRREVQRAGREPVRLIDPNTREEFVVIRAKDYEQMRRLVETEVIDPSFYEFEEKESPH